MTRSLRGAPLALGMLLLATAGMPARAEPRPARGGAAAAEPGQARRVRAPVSRREVDARARRLTALLGRARGRPSQSVARRALLARAPQELSRLVAAHDSQTDALPGDTAGELRTAAALARTAHALERAAPGTLPAELAERVSRTVARARYDARVDRHETAVEIETPRTPAILDALATADGTVGPILREGGRPAPEFLRVRAGEGGDPATVPWDSLTRAEKLEVLRSQSAGRSFFADRHIPGVVFRRSLSNRTDAGAPRVRSANLRGVRQRGGRVNVEGVLMERVEYMGPKAVDGVSGMEVHVRQTGPASRNLRDARTVERLLDVPWSARHEHVTTKLDPRVRRGSAVDRVALVDFYRRVNLVAELDIVAAGRGLRPNRDGAVTYFDWLRADQLGTLNQHFRSIARGGRGALWHHGALKMAAVGFRPGELYRDPHLIGFEVRTLSTRGQEIPDRYLRFVDAVQRGLVGRHYGVERAVLTRWYDERVGAVEPLAERDAREDAAVATLHFNRALPALLSALPEGVLVGERARAVLEARAGEEYSLKILVHDWGRDPVLAARPDRARAVRDAQRRSLAALEAGADPTSTVSEFVRAAGLHELYARSIGM